VESADTKKEETVVVPPKTIIDLKPDLPKDLGSSIIKEPENQKVPPLNLPPMVKKKTWPWIVAGVIASGVGGYFLLHGHANPSSSGGPVGVPVHWD